MFVLWSQRQLLKNDTPAKSGAKDNMYTTTNFKKKKEFKAAVEAYLKGEPYPPAPAGMATLRGPTPVRLYAPGLGSPKENGTEFVEGPHYPAPHSWYAQVTVKDGIVVKVK